MVTRRRTRRPRSKTRRFVAGSWKLLLIGAGIAAGEAIRQAVIHWW